MGATVNHGSELSAADRKWYETRAVLLLMVVLGPAVAVAVVGSYGFAIWMSQLLLGPPSG